MNPTEIIRQKRDEFGEALQKLMVEFTVETGLFITSIDIGTLSTGKKINKVIITNIGTEPI